MISFSLSFASSSVFCLVRFHICIRSYSVCLWLISLSIMPSRSSVLWQMAGFSSFSGWVLFYCVCTCVHACACVCVFYLRLWCKYLFDIVFLFPLDVFLEARLLDHMVVLFLIFWGTSILLSIVGTPVYIPTNNVPFSPHPPQLLLFLIFSIVAVQKQSDTTEWLNWTDNGLTYI